MPITPKTGSSFHADSHIPFPTSHPLWAGNLPTKASEIAGILRAYDAVFARGGKSLITLLYTEGSAVPAGCELFHLSADARNLGRTYATKLAVVGDSEARRSSGSLCCLVRGRAEQAERKARTPGRGGRCGVRFAHHHPAGCRSRDGSRQSVPTSQSSTKPLPPRCTCAAF